MEALDPAPAEGGCPSSPPPCSSSVTRVVSFSFFANGGASEAEGCPSRICAFSSSSSPRPIIFFSLTSLLSLLFRVRTVWRRAAAELYACIHLPLSLSFVFLFLVAMGEEGMCDQPATPSRSFSTPRCHLLRSTFSTVGSPQTKVGGRTFPATPPKQSQKKLTQEHTHTLLRRARWGGDRRKPLYVTLVRVGGHISDDDNDGDDDDA